MIYIDLNNDFNELAKLWTKGTSDIVIGNNADAIVSNLRNKVPCILINPWGHIVTNANAELTPESRSFVASVKNGIKNNICIVFGGPGEITLFGEASIRTGAINKSALGKSMQELQR